MLSNVQIQKIFASSPPAVGAPPQTPQGLHPGAGGSRPRAALINEDVFHKFLRGFHLCFLMYKFKKFSPPAVGAPPWSRRPRAALGLLSVDATGQLNIFIFLCQGKSGIFSGEMSGKRAFSGKMKVFGWREPCPKSKPKNILCTPRSTFVSLFRYYF